LARSFAPADAAAAAAAAGGSGVSAGEWQLGDEQDLANPGPPDTARG